MNKTVMEMCSKSSALYPLPQFPKCSRKMFVEPYVKMRALSTNSADGRHLWLFPFGLRFQA